MEIVVTNVNQALAAALRYLKVAGVVERSRNGDVIVAPEPVMTTYQLPQERVLFSPLRDANPFFHLMEALWMLGGRNDVAWPAFFAKNIENYSDDGIKLNGAYGYRWRAYFGFDQLKQLICELTERPDTRRAVLQMWDGAVELGYALDGGKDACCNTAAFFDLRGGRLNMTVLNRSNDAIWGAYGANAVHFSMLQEYMAAWLKKPIGLYRQFSNNLHVYTNFLPLEQFDSWAVDAESSDLYLPNSATRIIPSPYPIVKSCYSIADWDEDLGGFFSDPLGAVRTFTHPFFSDVAVWMYRAWYARKTKNGTGLEEAAMIKALDWREACVTWIERHYKPAKAVTA